MRYLIILLLAGCANAQPVIDRATDERRIANDIQANTTVDLLGDVAICAAARNWDKELIEYTLQRCNAMSNISVPDADARVQ